MILFAYGSLMKHFHNHHLLSDATFLGNVHTVDKYYMCGRLNIEFDEFEDGRQFTYPARKLLFPYIYQTSESHTYYTIQTHIYGELYEIENNIIYNLDIHEGHPTIYKRTKIPIQFNTSIIDADAYILENNEILSEITSNKNLFIPILNGNWKTAKLSIQ